MAQVPRVGDPDPGCASDMDTDDVVYVDTNVEGRNRMMFNPLRVTTRPEVLGFLRLKEEDLDPGLGPHGPEFTPASLGVPCESVSVKSDGNCLFRAMSYAICGREDYHPEIRRWCVEELRARASDRYNDMLRALYASTEDYVSDTGIETLGAWATELEIFALANGWNVTVYTYSYDRWFAYAPVGAKDPHALPGIYLRHRDCHYEPVVCVMTINPSTCYGLCKSGRERNRLERYDYPYVYRNQAPEQSLLDVQTDRGSKGGVEHTLRGLNPKTSELIQDKPVRRNERMDSGAEPCTETFQGSDSQRRGIDGVRVTVPCRAEREDRDVRKCSMLLQGPMFSVKRYSETDREALCQDPDATIQNWLTVVSAWTDFLHWLKDRWWGAVPQDRVVRFLETNEGCNSIVISEPLDTKIGALCSVTSMGASRGAVSKTAISLERGLYMCAELKGYYTSPRIVVLELSRLLRRKIANIPPDVPSPGRSFFSEAKIPARLRELKRGAMNKAWWGNYSNTQELQKIVSTLERVPLRRRPSAMVALTDATEARGPGYLFEIVNLSKDYEGRGVCTRYKVVFSARGFSVVSAQGKGCLASHMDIEALIHQLIKTQRLTFVSRD